MTPSRPPPQALPVPPTLRADQATQRIRWLGWLGWLWVPAAIACLALIIRHGQAVPYWDQFAIAEYLVRTADLGHPTWHDLFAQHNESRKLFPRLLFWFLTFFGNWDPRREMIAHWLLILLTVLLLSRILRRSLPAGQAAGATAIVGTLFYTVAQWQNLLWGIQIITAVPALSLTIGLWAVGCRGVSLGWRTAVCLVAATVATFSYANGMLLWPLLAVAVAGAPAAQRRARIVSTIVIVASGLASIALYFHGYIPPAGHPPATFVARHPADAAQFIFALLANGMRVTLDTTTAVWIGAIAFCLNLLSVAFLLARAIRQRDPSLLGRLMPWALLLGYSVISAATTAVGRLAYGVQYGLSERYVTFAIPFWAATVVLPLLALNELRSLSASARAAMMGLGGGLLAALYFLAVPLALREAAQYANNRRAALTAAMWIRVAPNAGELFEGLYPDPSACRTILDALDRTGLLPFKLLEGRFAEDYPSPPQEGARRAAVSIGHVDEVRLDKGMVHLRGWALNPRSRRLPADAIVFTVKDGSNKNRIVAMTSITRFSRPDVVAANPGFHANCGWAVSFPETQLDPALPLGVWSFDAKLQSLSHLQDVVIPQESRAR